MRYYLRYLYISLLPYSFDTHIMRHAKTLKRMIKLLTIKNRVLRSYALLVSQTKH